MKEMFEKMKILTFWPFFNNEISALTLFAKNASDCIQKK